MWDRPVVSLHGNGESVTLDNLAADWVLMQGAAGLGVSPVELSTAPLAGGGSVLQHRRFTEAEIVVPILLGRSRFMDRFEQRRTLERLCDGLVEIRIETAEGTRSRWGWYSDGLQGDYGEGEDSIDGQKLALTFLCLDQFWKGEEHSFIYKVDAPKKPFLSVATNGRENLWEDRQLDDYTQSVWDRVDGGLEKAGEERIAGLDLDDWKVEATEGTPFTVDLSLKFLTGDGKGKARIVGVSYKDGVKLSETTLMETNRSGRFGSSFYPAPGADAVSVGLYVADSMGRDQRIRVSNVVLWGPTEPPPPPEWVEVGRNLCIIPATYPSGRVANISGASSVPNQFSIEEDSTAPSGAGLVARTVFPYDVEVTFGRDLAYDGGNVRLSPEAGEVYTQAIMVKSSVALSMRVQSRMLEDGSIVSETYSYGDVVVLEPDVWTRLSVTSTPAPRDGLTLQFLINSWAAQTIPEGTVLSFDAAIYVEGETLPEWFSGDSAPDGMRSEWLGKPNNSASVLYELQ